MARLTARGVLREFKRATRRQKFRVVGKPVVDPNLDGLFFKIAKERMCPDTGIRLLRHLPAQFSVWGSYIDATDRRRFKRDMTKRLGA